MVIEIVSGYKKFMPDKDSKLKIERGPGKERPAWVYIEGLPPRTGYIRLRLSPDKPLKTYGCYLTSRIPLFVPLDYTKDELRIYYDKLASTYDEYVPNNAEDAEFLFSKIAPEDKSAKILDLGCGTGFGAAQFAKAGYANLTLTDYSEGMLEVAKRKRGLKGYKFIHANLHDLQLKEKFDLIFSLHSFAVDSYFSKEDMPRLYKKVAGWLKPDGKLALLDYNYPPPVSLFEKVNGGTFGADLARAHNWGIWERE